MNKADLDREVAALTGVPQETIRLVTAEFMAAIKRAIIEGEDVHIRDFGGFHYRAIAQGARKLLTGYVAPCSRFMIAFRSSGTLRKSLREKYGKDHVH